MAAGLALDFLNWFSVGDKARIQPVERTLDLTDEKRRDSDIASGGFNPGMAEQGLDDASVSTVLEQVSSEAVSTMPHAA
jgi:hypothetical protein